MRARIESTGGERRAQKRRFAGGRKMTDEEMRDTKISDGGGGRHLNVCGFGGGGSSAQKCDGR
ncbi:hypothetical protein BGZ63DRAFT_394694 [Mariannaea sp. PMI_226]|nr:hypothetical protein BGZ63DRAFT_394694 [Mariannaea sp. PMI_226]